MNKSSFFKLFFTIAICFNLSTVNQVQAQNLKIDPKLFNMTIHGTTNVHDFQSKVTQVNGELILNASKQVQSLAISIPVKSIKSGEKLMDTKTYEAFNVEKYPNITFKLAEVNSLQINNDEINVVITGELSMAGNTRKISVKSTGKITKAGLYQFKGSIGLKMTDFKMKPPTAMLGVMKVGDAIILKFDATFNSNQLTLK